MLWPINLRHVHRSNGFNCIVKCPEVILNTPPPLGSTVTVKHQGVYSTGILKNPVYWREAQLVSLNQRKKVGHISLLILEKSMPGRPPHALRLPTDQLSQVPDWTNHKAFFDQLAQVMNILQPSEWYKVTREDFYKNGSEATSTELWQLAVPGS
jgi:hypothetical protein